MRNRAFSLIELMVAVSILAIGLVLIGRSFLSASNAISNADNRLTALDFLENKVSAVEEDELKGAGRLEDIESTSVIRYRTFTYSLHAAKVNIGEGDTKQSIDSVLLRAGWKEGARYYDEVIGTYISLKEQI